MPTPAPTPDLIALYSAYAVALDTLDPELFARCFTDDAVIVSPSMTARGREEMLDWFSLSRLGPVHHAFNLLVLDHGPEELSSRADWLVYEQGAIIASGTYRDTVRLDPDGPARFSRREIAYTWRPTTSP